MTSARSHVRPATAKIRSFNKNNTFAQSATARNVLVAPINLKTELDQEKVAKKFDEKYSQLPSRIVNFMNKNDLPVYVVMDKTRVLNPTPKELPCEYSKTNPQPMMR